MTITKKLYLCVLFHPKEKPGKEERKQKPEKETRTNQACKKVSREEQETYRDKYEEREHERKKERTRAQSITQVNNLITLELSVCQN